jgi:hypothetical protein
MSTISGSNWLEEQRAISATASSKGRAFLYGLSEVSASKVSATASILASRESSEPFFWCG